MPLKYASRHVKCQGIYQACHWEIYLMPFKAFAPFTRDTARKAHLECYFIEN